ncbi:MAG: hypothetical protein ACTSRJ_04820 [Candidatus Hodarchaeales archaeon]
MPSRFARFVVFYKNGETIVEDRSDNYCWDNLPKKNIAAMGVLYDPLILDERDGNGKQLRLSDIPQSLILKGSKRHNYKFFQFKTIDLQVGGSKERNSGRHEVNLSIGMVVDKEGHCIVLEAAPDINIKTYYTTVHSLRLNLEIFEIKLNEID